MDIYREENKLKGMGASERLRWRQTAVREKVDAYFSFLETIQLGDPSISEKMKDAVNYSLNQKKYLCRFLKSGDVPIDNGFCEGQLDVLYFPERGRGIRYHVHDRGDREIQWCGRLFLS